jgi:ABC-type branched-subunit amino acid transport system ATPase component
MPTIKKLLFLLNIYGRKRTSLLVVLILIMAFLDMLGVASILPFIAVLTNPNLIETNFILNYIFQITKIIGVENNQQFFFVLSVFLYTILLVSLAVKALAVYVQVQFVEMLQFKIAKHLVEGYLYQPYSWFLERHSADLGKTVLSEVGEVIGGAIRPFLTIITKVIVAAALITLLVIVNPKLAFIIFFFLSGIYGIFYFSIKNYLVRKGKERYGNNNLRFMSVSEAFGAVKEIKVRGLEQSFIKLFINSSKLFSKSKSSYQVVAQLPRFILEAIVFGGILLITFYISSQTSSFNDALPIISLYVYAGYRLMPAIQEIYNSFTSLTFHGPSVDRLTVDLKNLKPFRSNQDQGILSFNKTIVLKNIYYNYPNSSRTVLKNINLSIAANSIVGLVGPTGCGKTTTADIILGLLEPQKGTLEVDGKIITQHNIRSWQNLIGYVPQQIFLSDDTIEANIAFGIESKDINQENVKKSSKIANIHNFVLEELPKQYQTKVGERGIRLSGGQRQRIGIARALYHEPKVLILDEATSALDNKTEKAVMDTINNLAKQVTVILIAHRLSILKKCDQIFLLEKGKLKHQGTFEELINIDENFRKSANI